MSTLWLNIVDANYRPLPAQAVRVETGRDVALKYQREDERWVGEAPRGARLAINISAEGFEPERHEVVLHSEITQAVIGLRRPGELSYTYGNDRPAFAPIDDQFLLCISGAGAQDFFERLADKFQLEWRPVSKAMGAKDELFVRIAGDIGMGREMAQILQEQQLSAQIARIIEHEGRTPFGLTDELVVRFQDDVTRREAERMAAVVDMRIMRPLHHAGNAFLLAGGDVPDYELLTKADFLMQSGRVVYVEPNLLFVLELDAYTPDDPLWGQVQHLQLIDVDDAWDLMDDLAISLRGGSPNITVAAVDVHGVAPDHPDLTATLTDGTGKMVANVNFLASPIVNQTVGGLAGDHGTQCAGSAVGAFDDNRGLPGVAPNCHLIGARLNQAVTAVKMADVYLWMGGFMNGSTEAGFPAAPPPRPADVITTSYGSNGVTLANTVRDCFDFLTTYGRNGKGVVLCFSLGNNGYIDYTNTAGGFHRAWPTYEKTLGVGSSINVNPTNPLPLSSQPDPNGNTTNIPTAVDTRTLFSPYGATALRKPDLVSPSHTAYAGGLVDPIMSAVRVGTGDVDGCPGPPVCDDYELSFGGTSHSTPTVAGAVALILSARPELNWVQVREILRQSCARIDAGQANLIGQWQDLDSDGAIDYSRWYGAGRLDVDAAINLALDPALPLADVYVRENLTDIGGVPSTGNWWASPDIWVRQDAATPIPALAWTDPAPHENARRGQDNAVFCRVRNRGAAAAPVVYVRAMLTHWAGLEFIYPDDFQPSNNVGAPVPSPLVPGTYLIGEARIDNLAPGANQIVKFTWPMALIPPETVLVSGVTVTWHPCLLVEVSPHDGPNPVGGLSVPVQGNNNLAQRNIQIVNSGDLADLFVGMIAGTRVEAGLASLILDASALRGEAVIRLHVADERQMAQLPAAVKRAVHTLPVLGQPGRACTIVVETKARLRVVCGDSETVMEAAPGTKFIACAGGGQAKPVTSGLTLHQDIPAVEIKGLQGQLEIPFRLSGGQFVPLLVAVAGDAAGDLVITQRRGDGELSAGYGIQRVN